MLVLLEGIVDISFEKWYNYIVNTTEPIQIYLYRLKGEI